MEKLLVLYPDIPDSLLQLLEIVDGTSQLFIDFSPSAKGKKRQILRYLHDPDELVVVADSFDAYLQMLIDNKYDFITEEKPFVKQQTHSGVHPDFQHYIS